MAQSTFNDIKKQSNYWIAAQDRINLSNEITFLKTHSALCTFENNPFTNKSNTKAVIYVVRDPRNLITSFSHHYSMSTIESFNFIINKCIWSIYITKLWNSIRTFNNISNIYNCNFQLEVNSEDDITYFNSFHPFGDFVPDSSIVLAQIEPAPFVLIPTLGEHLDFSYSFPNNSRVIIRVFDISGRFITSIVDRYFEQAGQVNRLEDHAEWDGRDHLGQIVQPGTYIMHMEVMNPVTGVTQTDAAPIVVGVKN